MFVVKNTCTNLGALLENVLAVVPGMSAYIVVLRQEVDDIWDSVRFLEEGAKLVRGKLMLAQKEHMQEHAKQITQRALLTMLGQQASQAAAAASSSARGGRSAQVDSFWPTFQQVGLPMPPTTQPGGSRPGSRSGSPGRIANVCDSWRKEGSCPRGAACKFAASHIPR